MINISVWSKVTILKCVFPLCNMLRSQIFGTHKAQVLQYMGIWQNYYVWARVMVHTYNPNMQKAITEPERFLVQGQYGLHSKIQRQRRRRGKK